jgi:hypothetical protein
MFEEYNAQREVAAKLVDTWYVYHEAEILLT